MSAVSLLLPVLFPMVAGGLLRLTQRSYKKTEGGSRVFCFLSMTVTLLTSVFVIFILLRGNIARADLLTLTSTISFTLTCDGLSKVFAGMVAILWPIALLYAFTYMREDENRFSYLSYYVMTYGVVLGIAFGGNYITLYCFYELLTFVTLPLIIHGDKREARRAGRYYLYFSLSGSSLALGGIVILTVLTGADYFTAGGVLTEGGNVAQLAYLLTFFGFGVKAAVYPLCHWLPMASAAPTPTTALLHAVAVVKSGAFAIMRTTFFAFSPEFVRNGWAGKVALVFAGITILAGSGKALREQHLKRRFAYSTVANLSYILFGVLLCTGDGLYAGLCHFLMHSVAKIGIFFCCGAIMETTGATYVYELNGMGRKMPMLFSVYTVCGLSLVGIPLFGGFISKFYLVKAGLLSGSIGAYFGIAAIICSAVFTAIYVLTVTVRAFFVKPSTNQAVSALTFAREPSPGFLIPCGIFAVLSVVLGVYASPLLTVLQTVVGGIV